MKRYRLDDTTALCDPDGEWVKWVDVFRHELTAEIDNMLINGIETKECNCEEKYNTMTIQWICPAHGYKRR